MPRGSTMLADYRSHHTARVFLLCYFSITRKRYARSYHIVVASQEIAAWLWPSQCFTAVRFPRCLYGCNVACWPAASNCYPSHSHTPPSSSQRVCTQPEYFSETRVLPKGRQKCSTVDSPLFVSVARGTRGLLPTVFIVSLCAQNGDEDNYHWMWPTSTQKYSLGCALS